VSVSRKGKITVTTFLYRVPRIDTSAKSAFVDDFWTAAP
jgi:hypothetical protein